MGCLGAHRVAWSVQWSTAIRNPFEAGSASGENPVIMGSATAIFSPSPHLVSHSMSSQQPSAKNVVTFETRYMAPVTAPGSRSTIQPQSGQDRRNLSNERKIGPLPQCGQRRASPLLTQVQKRGRAAMQTTIPTTDLMGKE